MEGTICCCQDHQVWGFVFVCRHVSSFPLFLTILLLPDIIITTTTTTTCHCSSRLHPSDLPSTPDSRIIWWRGPYGLSLEITSKLRIQRLSDYVVKKVMFLPLHTPLRHRHSYFSISFPFMFDFRSLPSINASSFDSSTHAMEEEQGELTTCWSYFPFFHDISRSFPWLLSHQSK